MSKTNISWASHSLNFYTWDCTPVSDGCKNCYALAMARRYSKPVNGLPQWRETAVNEWQCLKSGDVVFVNSMSDTYHENAPIEWIQRIHTLAAGKPDTIFLLLTKRIKRVAQLADQLVWPANLWLGVSIESPKYLWRMGELGTIPAYKRFISAEPLLASLWPDLASYDERYDKISWWIVGGESGPNRRPFYKQWATEVQHWCNVTGAHFTFKQGSAFKPGGDNSLFGKTYLTTPFTLRLEQRSE